MWVRIPPSLRLATLIGKATGLKTRESVFESLARYYTECSSDSFGKLRGLISLMFGFDSRHCYDGLLVIMVALLVCTQAVRVRLPCGPRSVGVTANTLPSQGRDYRFESDTEYEAATERRRSGRWRSDADRRPYRPGHQHSSLGLLITTTEAEPGEGVGKDG